jgi:hypothetical protein
LIDSFVIRWLLPELFQWQQEFAAHTKSARQTQNDSWMNDPQARRTWRTVTARSDGLPHQPPLGRPRAVQLAAASIKVAGVGAKIPTSLVETTGNTAPEARDYPDRDSDSAPLADR